MASELLSFSKRLHVLLPLRLHGTLWSYLAALRNATVPKVALAIMLAGCLSFTLGIGFLLLLPLLQLVGFNTQQ